MTRSEEQRLIRLAVAGDRDACEAFIKAHQASLYAYMLRLSGRPDVAEDTVQEAFVRVLTNLDRFDDKYRFSTWLFTIAKRLYVNACMKHKPAYDSDVVGAREGKGVGPEWSAEREEIHDNTHDALQEVLMRLVPEQREILVLFHQMEWPIALIARHLKMPEGTVKSHLHRGRRKLREMLEASEQRSSQVQEVWN
jgi:RNA polymerase sigma-70 factor (ECF subfamily)